MRTFRTLLPILLMTPSLAKIPDLAELQRMIARFAPVELRADTSKLSTADRQALDKLTARRRTPSTIFS